MKTALIKIVVIVIIWLLCLAKMAQGQVKDSSETALLTERLARLEYNLEAINKNSERFANLNNVAGLLYFSGLAIAGLNYFSESPSPGAYYFAGGLTLTGTATLYFSGNMLKRKKYYLR